MIYIQYIFNIYIVILRNVKQQPTLLANMGRLVTVIRWMIEHCICMFNQRYGIWHKIPRHVTGVAGVMMQHCHGVHIQFEIGKIKPSNNRLIAWTLMRMNLDRWLHFHPITDGFFKFCWKEVNKTNGWLKHCLNMNDIYVAFNNNIDLVNKFILDELEIYAKGGGSHNVKKSKNYLWQSKNVIQLYCGIYMGKPWIFIKNILKNMKIYYKGINYIYY